MHRLSIAGVLCALVMTGMVWTHSSWRQINDTQFTPDQSQKPSRALRPVAESGLEPGAANLPQRSGDRHIGSAIDGRGPTGRAFVFAAEADDAASFALASLSETSLSGTPPQFLAKAGLLLMAFVLRSYLHRK